MRSLLAPAGVRRPKRRNVKSARNVSQTPVWTPIDTDALDGSPAWRVSAHDLEKLVCDRLSEQLIDQHFIHNIAGGIEADVLSRLLAKADLIAATLRSGAVRDRAGLLPNLLARIDLHEDRIDLTIDPERFAITLGLAGGSESGPLIISMPAARVRRGHQVRLIIPGPQQLDVMPTCRDTKLVELLAEAHEARQLVLASPDQSIAGIAAAQGRCRTRLGKLAALGCLAPDIITAIVEGRQPVTLTARVLQNIDLPFSWADQRTLLGFA